MRINILLSAVLGAATCFAQVPSEQAANEAPVATVAGQVILDSELQPLVEGQLRQLQYQEYVTRRKALENLINQKLVAAKAKEKGLTPEEFLRQNVDSKLPDPTEAQVQAFYFHQRNLSNIPFQQVKTQLVAALKQQNVDRARADYFQSLRAAADVTVMLKPPRVRVSDDPGRVLGNPDAPVTIVEFADFECPYCHRATATLRELLTKYDGQVRLSFRDFPLEEIHPGAELAAEAARCASAQGKFWAYHDVLLGNTEELNAENLTKHARGLGLDSTQFDACLQEHKFKGQIEDDMKAGMEAGVSGTPAFFINGVFFNGLQPVSMFESVIDDELASVKGHANKPQSGGN